MYVLRLLFDFFFGSRLSVKLVPPDKTRQTYYNIHLPFQQVEAYDPDIKDRNAPQNIVYSLVKHEQKEYLQIDNDGCLRLTKPLDRDQPLGFTRWQILIMAADHGGRLGSDSLRSTTEVILELTDINDNAPFLTNVSILIVYIRIFCLNIYLCSMIN